MQLPKHSSPTGVGCPEGELLLPGPNLPLTDSFIARLCLAVCAHSVQRPRGGGLHNVILVKDRGTRPWCGHPAPSSLLKDSSACNTVQTAQVPEAGRRLSPCPSTSYAFHVLGHGTCHPSLAFESHYVSPALNRGEHPQSPALSHGEHTKSLN